MGRALACIIVRLNVGISAIYVYDMLREYSPGNVTLNNMFIDFCTLSEVYKTAVQGRSIVQIALCTLRKTYDHFL